MKKLIVLTGLILGLSVMTLNTSAQTTASPDKSATAQTSQTAAPGQGKFVDNNKDGVCDNHQNMAKAGKCSQFTDKNGDGKCDNCQGNGNCGKGNCAKATGNCCGNGPGKGMGMQHRNGQGNCPRNATVQPDKK